MTSAPPATPHRSRSSPHTGPSLRAPSRGDGSRPWCEGGPGLLWCKRRPSRTRTSSSVPLGRCRSSWGPPRGDAAPEHLLADGERAVAADADQAARPSANVHSRPQMLSNSSWAGCALRRARPSPRIVLDWRCPGWFHRAPNSPPSCMVVELDISLGGEHPLVATMIPTACQPRVRRLGHGPDHRVQAWAIAAAGDNAKFFAHIDSSRTGCRNASTKSATEENRFTSRSLSSARSLRNRSRTDERTSGGSAHR